MVLSFSTPAERPAYIGVANTMLSPIAIAGPLLAAALAEATSYALLFGVLAMVGVVGLLALHWGVATPQRAVSASSSD